MLMGLHTIDNFQSDKSSFPLKLQGQYMSKGPWNLDKLFTFDLILTFLQI